MTVRRRVVVRGRVQGVFFRDSCRREADTLGLSGSVWNRRDGAVEAVFEGEQAAVETLVDWCRRGPAQAHVSSVEVADEQPTGDRGFQVRGTTEKP